jgi:hypothetical protein
MSSAECHYFHTGKCKRGSECNFKHTEPALGYCPRKTCKMCSEGKGKRKVREVREEDFPEMTSKPEEKKV